MNVMSKILIKTSDAQLFLMLRHLLSVEGFDAELVSEIRDLTSAEIGGELNASVLILDSGEADLFEFSHLKGQLPGLALILLAKSGIDSRLGINERLDLVLKRPFDPFILLQFLQRYRGDFTATGVTRVVLTYCDLLLNRSQFRVYRNGHHIDLTPLEFSLLEALMQKPEIVWSRQDLIDAVWGRGAIGEPRTVDIHIGHIRRALVRHGPNLIRTVQGRGYALDRPADPFQ
ncbi:response regulator transcription factor [Brucella tritici]|uniref:Response regulator transcription factor n=2 Tax=Brucella tritici TaxID=94626 RepID=A0A7X6FPV0_9HYPH|nr:response regulator transcription factor [Brucella tritici]NKW09589.1 response regulator transcription factor [Brucella tritici]